MVAQKQVPRNALTRHSAGKSIACVTANSERQSRWLGGDHALTVYVYVHHGAWFCARVEGADALAIVRVPQIDAATTAGSEEKVTILVIPHTCQRPVVALEQDRTHHSLPKMTRQSTS